MSSCSWFMVYCARDFTVCWLYMYRCYGCRAIHLSNNSVQKHHKNQESRSDSLPDDNMWTSDEFAQYLRYGISVVHLQRISLSPRTSLAGTRPVSQIQHTSISSTEPVSLACILYRHYRVPQGQGQGRGLDGEGCSRYEESHFVFITMHTRVHRTQKGQYIDAFLNHFYIP